MRRGGKLSAARLTSERDAAIEQANHAVTLAIDLKRTLSSMAGAVTAAAGAAAEEVDHVEGLTAVEARAAAQAARDETSALRDSLEALRREHEAELCAAAAIALAIEQSYLLRPEETAGAAASVAGPGAAAAGGAAARRSTSERPGILTSDGASHPDETSLSHMAAFFWVGSPLVFAIIALVVSVALGPGDRP